MTEQQAPTWADPTPAALFAVAAGTTAVWALLTGKIVLTDLPSLIVWLLGAALILSICGLINFRRGDTVGGSLNLAFGVLFFGVPAMVYLFIVGGVDLASLGLPIPPTTVINGWVFFVLALVLIGFLPIIARQSALFFIALSTFVVAVVILALYNLQPMAATMVPGVWHTLGQVSGWMIGLAGLLMLYIGIAMALIHGMGRIVLPVGPPLTKPKG